MEGENCERRRALLYRCLPWRGDYHQAGFTLDNSQRQCHSHRPLNPQTAALTYRLCGKNYRHGLITFTEGR
ncbi:hypothetical protein BTJ39_05720 [Izhakiella australiensis]|uniref:Uncharacterized protein n=1 Tax=Izhakiella australiensis TaxID=1926881 RepID=A0A1S8YQU2_9GAMM|nr:hypothetical protein BTJ39_05720 [Izhakiella australiensis]